MDNQFETLLDNAEQSLETLSETTEDEDVQSRLEKIELLLRVVEEAQDLLETIDLSELPETIDAEKSRDAIDTGEIPAALEEGDGKKIVKIRRLIRAINVAELWDAVDIGEFWKEKGEFDEVLNDLTEEGEGGDESFGEVLEDTADIVSGGEGDALLEEADEMGNELKAGVQETVGSAEAALEDGNLHEYQEIIQQEAMEGINEFRDALVDAHGLFEEVYDRNREEMRRTDRSTHSRNPTAVSTLPLSRTDVGSTARYSTVPNTVRYSTAPPLERIYGKRFKRAREKRPETA